MYSRRFFLILGISFMVFSGSVLAAFVPNTSWTGSVSSNWNNSGNWDSGVPTSSDQAAIDDVGGYSVVIGSGTNAVASAIQTGWADSSVSHATIIGLEELAQYQDCENLGLGEVVP